ncbi:unnamed protein product [Victoria cruziana]
MCSSVVSMKPTEGHRKLFPSISSVCRAWELSGTHLFRPEAAAVRVRFQVIHCREWNRSHTARGGIEIHRPRPMAPPTHFHTLIFR